jgi:hypothetical protein
VHSSERAAEWFNTSCFAQPGSFSFGNEPRVDPTLRGNGEFNFDTVLSKSFPITRNVSFKFSGEVFNLFNHPQFSLPNSEVGIGIWRSYDPS